MLECLMQEQLKVIGVDLPAWLEEVEGVQRVILSGEVGEFEDELAQLPLKLQWIVFSPDKQEGFTRCYLTPQQRLKLIFREFSSHLYYQLSDSLTKLDKVESNDLWIEGTGIAFPVEDLESDIRKAINLQVDIATHFWHKENMFDRCLVIAFKDSYGVSVIWRSEWEQAEHLKEWAAMLAEKYPWQE